MTSADQGSEQTAVNKEHADTLRSIREVVKREWLETRGGLDTKETAAFEAAIALLDPPQTSGHHTAERERCVQFALEITRIEQHHGVAEIADVIQRARAERCDKCLTNISETETEMNTLRAENERLRTGLTSRNNLCRSLRDERDLLQTKHAVLVKAVRAHCKARHNDDEQSEAFDEQFLADALKGEP